MLNFFALGLAVLFPLLFGTGFTTISRSDASRTFGVGRAVSFSDTTAFQARGENFEPVDCSEFKISEGEFECGYVIVPERHDDPDGHKIKLATTVLPSTGDSPTPDAFIVAQGGPGGSTLDTFAAFFGQGFYPGIQKLREERDIVLFDQRGALYSQPALTCPEELALTLETIEQVIPREEQLKQSTAAALACRERLVTEGIDLAAYNSFENALDIEDVRRALGYNAFDLYGVSYGTLLGLHALRETPSTFRSVILDAVVPTQTNPNVEIALSQQRAFEQLFNACETDEACASAYPNLKQVFYGLVDEFNATPARFEVRDDETGKTYDAVIQGDDFLDILFQLIYNTEVLPALPQMIYDARDGRFTLLEAFYPLIVFDRTFASGMYYSVMCGEDADFTVEDVGLEGVDPHIAKTQSRDTAAFLDLCEKWDVPQLGAAADKVVHANVPTMLLSGDFDPITPPPFGETAAETLSPSYIFEFPAYGHGAMTSGNCPNEIIAEFVSHPEQAPNAECIREEAANVNFITPRDTLVSRAIGKFQFAMLQGKIEQFVVPIVLVLILLSVWGLGPLLWLIRHAQKRPSEPNLLPRLIPWIAALASAAALAFFLIVFVLVLVAALRSENTIGLILGAPRSWLVVYLVPLVFTVCAAFVTFGAVRAWQRKDWDTARRVYYSMLAICAAGLAVWFGVNGLIFGFAG